MRSNWLFWSFWALYYSVNSLKILLPFKKTVAEYWISFQPNAVKILFFYFSKLNSSDNKNETVKMNDLNYFHKGFISFSSSPIGPFANVYERCSFLSKYISTFILSRQSCYQISI